MTNLLKRKCDWEDCFVEEPKKLGGFSAMSLKHLKFPYPLRFIQQIGEELSVNEDEEVKEKLLTGSISNDERNYASNKKKQELISTHLGLTVRQIWCTNRSYRWKVMDTLHNEAEALRNALPYVVHSFLTLVAAQHQAVNAEQELLKLATDGTIWQTMNGRQILNQITYANNFPKPERRISGYTWREASRDSVQVNMDQMQLASLLTNEKWCDLFPTIVSRAVSFEVISSGKSYDNPDGSLQLIYNELQVTSPLIPNQKLILHRSCRQIDPNTWVIVDTSIDPPQDVGYASSCRCLPSGCLLQGIGDGLSKVTWVVHLEIKENKRIDNFYFGMLHSGFAYGAERWVACLKRSCERISYANGGDHWNEGKQHVMSLAKRMVRSFFVAMNTNSGRHIWSSVFGEEKMKMYVTLRESDDPDQMVVGAVTTVSVPFSPEFVFGVLREETNRAKWDVLLSHKKHTKLSDFASGDEAGNNISTFLVDDMVEPSVLQLQESSIDSSGSLLVWSAVDKDAFDQIMDGDEDIYTSFMPSGFAINSQPNIGSIDTGGSSFITFVLQMLTNRRELSEDLRTALMEHTFRIIKNTFKKVHTLLLQSSLA